MTNNVPVPDFVDVDASAVLAAEAAAKDRASSTSGWNIPEDVKLSDPKGVKKLRHGRWMERATINAAYRTVTSKGLIDVVVQLRSRTGEPNDGRSQFVHFYINPAVQNGTADEDTVKRHSGMNENSYGVLATLLRSTGLLPANGSLKGSLLNMMFPQKGQPGSSSPLVGKAVYSQVHVTVGKKVEQVEGEDGMAQNVEVDDVRIQIDAFLPSTGSE